MTKEKTIPNYPHNRDKRDVDYVNSAEIEQILIVLNADF